MLVNWFRRRELADQRTAEQLMMDVAKTPARGFDRFAAAGESLSVLLLGFAVMMFFYHANPKISDGDIGVPEHDSWYHMKMAATMPEWGLVPKFPWLQNVYWRSEGDAFVSHHFGFQLMLMPFVRISHWLTGDYVPGARVFCALIFGLNLVLFNLLLRHANVPLRWFWIVLFLLMPGHFFSRHAFVRAIGPSLLFMQLAIYVLFRGWYIIAALVLAGYVQLYLGAVMYGPVLVATHGLAMVLAAREGTSQSVRDTLLTVGKMSLITAGGWLLGVLTYPYASGMFEFLVVQVTSSGLNPNPTAQVGREWYPYNNTWEFVGMMQSTLPVWIIAFIVRMRSGPPINAKELTLTLLSLGFMLLLLKARRFVEYWPILALLAAAYLSAPAVRAGIEKYKTWFDPDAESNDWTTRLTWLATLICAAGLTIVLAWKQPTVRSIIAVQPWFWFGVIAAAGICVALSAGRGFMLRMSPQRVLLRAAGTLCIAVALIGGTVAAGAEHFKSVADGCRCYYNRKDVREVMEFVEKNSAAGDVVFTDDWDIFCIYFYYNTHNYFMVGLDPEFTNHYRPDLWKRYVKITRAEVPTKTTIKMRQADGTSKDVALDIKMEDIRDVFNAKFVVIDDDHHAFSEALSRRPELAELIYPQRDYAKCQNAAYLVFRVRSAEEQAGLHAVPKADAQGYMHLGDLSPVTADQGYGELGINKSVDRNALAVAGKKYTRGLGTHAPAKLLYDIPTGVERFEASVGVDDETAGKGSIIARVVLDGRTVFESPVLTGGKAPAVVNIPLAGAKQLLLEIDPTRDGNKFDHADWIEPRFVRPKSATPTTTSRNSDNAE